MLQHGVVTFQQLLFCAVFIGICRAQSFDFRHQPQQQQQQQQMRTQPGAGGTVPEASANLAQRQQQQQPNLNAYDPSMLLKLYGQQQNGRGSINNNNGMNNNNGTRSAIGTGTFGTGMDQLGRHDAASTNGTRMALAQQRMIGAGPTEGADAGSGTADVVGHHGHGSVQVQVQLRSYTNAGFRLPDSRLCTCPAGNERCLHASPQRNGYNCLTSLAVFVLSADETIHFEETPYFPLNAAGQLGQQQEFGTPFRFRLHSEPSAIAVVVHNLGPQINMDGTLYETNTVTVVDTFVQPLLANTVPQPFADASRMAAVGTKMLHPFSAGGGIGTNAAIVGQPQQQMQYVQLQGRLVGTQLSLAFSIACRGPLVGPGCDLACNSSSANPSTAICQSRRTGFFTLCRWMTGGAQQQQQVTDCKNCPWGIKENAYCADGEGGVLEPSHAGVVSSSYYTAFIVLSCLCAFLLLCTVIACLITCKKVFRARRDAPAAFRRHQQAVASRAAANSASGGIGNGTAASSAPLITHGDPERALLTAAGARPTECDKADNGGFGTATFRRLGFGAEKGGGAAAKAPPPPYSVRSNGNASAALLGAVDTDQRSAGAALPGTPSRTSPFPLPRSGATSASGGRETPSVIAGSGANASARQRFPPPLAIGGGAKTTTAPSKALSPPRFQPLPHLGPPHQQQQQQQLRRSPAAPGGATTDSLNNSFAGGAVVGGSSSVSADV